MNNYSLQEQQLKDDLEESQQYIDEINGKIKLSEDNAQKLEQLIKLMKSTGSE